MLKATAHAHTSWESEDGRGRQRIHLSPSSKLSNLHDLGKHGYHQVRLRFFPY